jgi:GDPmannose 4,6-dehydratase
MLQHTEPDDYVIATNETHTVQDLVQYSFELVGLDWKDYVRVDERFLRPLDVNYLQGDFSKAEKVLGWAPKTKFHNLVKIMIEEESNRWRKWSKGDRFPWDAQNYPNENRILSPVAHLER